MRYLIILLFLPLTACVSDLPMDDDNYDQEIGGGVVPDEAAILAQKTKDEQALVQEFDRAPATKKVAKVGPKKKKVKSQK